MFRSIAIITALACAACGPSDACASIQLGRAAESLPLTSYSFTSQGGIFDSAFVNQLQLGPPEYRCCVGARVGRQLAGCPAQLDCTLFTAEAMQVGAPYSGAQHLGGYFCHVAVKDSQVVSVWGQYND